MIIKSAEFIKSATMPEQYPDTGLPEIAFAGRSNVGKSSLINCLVNRKNLVKTSSTPGKTRLINFFKVNDDMVFVDLPGYGYAKVSKQEKKKWGPMIEAYLADRKLLTGVMLLMDLRRQPREDEFLMAQWLSHYEIPGTIILTKADKLKKQAQQKQISAIARDFDLPADSFIPFSSKTGMGKEDVMGVIAQLMIMRENDD